MSDKQTFHVPVTSDDKTAIDCLAEDTDFSRQKLKQYMQQGCVWLERTATNNQEQNSKGFIQRLRRAKKIVNTGDTLHFYFDQKVLEAEAPIASLVADFGDYSIWNKPSGMLSQGSKWGDHCTLYRWAEQYLQPERPAFIVHRLDRAANGLMILAHKKKVATQFSRLFEQRKIDKHYHVKVAGNFVVEIPDKQEHLSITTDIDAKKAISQVRVLDYDAGENISTLEVKIETGRKHQIRKHLSELGYPVIGDRLYSSNKLDVDLQLQAVSLSFICPISAEKHHFTLVF